MPKYRKAYFEIEKALACGAYNIVILLGLRKTGKTEILKQLCDNKKGCYHDFKERALTYEEAGELLDREESLILLDEIGYLDDFDLFMSSLHSRAGGAGKQVVITSSAYGALKQLGSEYLGGGRSYKVELFPLSFEEYLHFSRDDFNYGDNYEPTEQDVQDFYRLKNIPFGMSFIIDRQYMMDTFTDIDAARANKYQDERDVVLMREQYISVFDIIAYTLNSTLSMKRLTGARIGTQEFINTKGLPISQSLIGLANRIVNKMASDLDKNIGLSDLAHIVAYLYHAGFLFIDLIANEDASQSIDEAVQGLFRLNTFERFELYFKKYNFCVISPLLYTRLMVDLEFIAGKESDQPHLAGELYELAVKSEFVQKQGYDKYHISGKYRLGVTEVDLWKKNLLLEATVRHKKQAEHSVDKILLDYELVRVLTDEPGMWEDDGIYYRIGYPKALLMLSNGSISKLEPRKVKQHHI
jgi:hypothetical protein